MAIFVLSRSQDGKVAHPKRKSAEWAAFAGELGVNLARARNARGLSQDRVAEMAGVSAYSYQKYEKGRSRPDDPANPTLVNLVAISQVLGVSVEELLPASRPDMTVGG